jgi:hypothetical protein
MIEYKEVQFGWLIFALLLPALAIITYLFLTEAGSRPLGPIEYMVICLITLFIYLLFYRLTTTISADRLSVSFGIGLIRKRIKFSRIKTVTVVKNPWYYGWGIRNIPNGMLYNMSGSDGVELTFTDTGRIIRIGSANAVRLKDEISKRLP